MQSTRKVFDFQEEAQKELAAKTTQDLKHQFFFPYLFIDGQLLKFFTIINPALPQHVAIITRSYCFQSAQICCLFQIVYISVMDRMKVRPAINHEFSIKTGKVEPSKQEMNSTPIRTRDPQNKQNSTLLNNRKMEMQRRPSIQDSDSHAFPYDPLMNSKTIPKKKVVVSPRGCVNHPDIDAEFKIEIEGETFGYCGKCAAHLASNGFTVQRIAGSRSPKLTKDTRPVQNKKRQELSNFLHSLRKLEQDYSNKYDAIENVKNSYEKERQNIGHFYEEMLDYISYIRDEHLQFLEEESHRNSQICDIQTAEISETLEEIQNMKGDIQTNMDKIVEEVQEESYLECMSYYQQKKGVHAHRLEELGQVITHSAFSTPEFIEEKLNSFKNFVDDITGMLNSKASVDY